MKGDNRPDASAQGSSPGESPPQGIPSPFGPKDVPRPWSVDDLARYTELSGARVRYFRGRPWTCSSKRFWCPLVACEALPRGDIGWPAHVALGFQAVVDQPEEATGVAAFLQVASVAEYGPERLGAERRREVRRALENLDLQVIHDPQLLLEQGWRVLSLAATRSGQARPRDEVDYRSRWSRAFLGAPPLVVVALRDGQLQGYMVSHAIPGVASIEEVVVAPWARGSGVGAALYWAHLWLWASGGHVSLAYVGRPFPERESIDYFKRSMGAEMVMLPVVSGMRAPVRWHLRRTRPEAYERLVGVTR